MHVLRQVPESAQPSPAAAEVLSELEVRAVVDAFYARVRQDDALGPVFGAAVADWDAHLEKLTAFWCKILFGTGPYKGNPMVVHREHQHVITPALFTRWLALWGEVTSATVPGAGAALLQAKAARMAQNLQAGLFGAAP
jgi:hemoglobin